MSDSFSIFLDTDVFIDSFSKPEYARILEHAANQGIDIFSSLTVLGETQLVILRKYDDYREKMLLFVDLLVTLNVQFLVPDDAVRVICYEMGNDPYSTLTGHPTDRTHLAYAISYKNDYNIRYFISSDKKIRDHELYAVLREKGFEQPEVIGLKQFKRIQQG